MLKSEFIKLAEKLIALLDEQEKLFIEQIELSRRRDINRQEIKFINNQLQNTK